MDIEKLVKQLNKVADMEGEGFISKHFLIRAAKTLESQQKEIDGLRKEEPVHCGECQRRPICRMWDLDAGGSQAMRYSDYCSKGMRYPIR